MTILFLALALWLQMSAFTTGISHLGGVTVDHGKLLSTQIACIKTYADGFIEYKPCEISTPPTSNFVKLVLSDIKPEFAEAAQRAADETDGKRNKNDIGPLPNYYDMRVKVCGVDDTKCVPIESAEPVDVPAVQVDYVAYKKGEFFSCGLNLCGAEEDITEKRPTCADKSRILEHDENSPPRYWCRKVEF